MKECEKKYGCDSASVECQDVKLQLQDKDLVIRSGTRRALKELTPDQQRHALLGICSFFCTTVMELQQKLPLKNALLQQLGCLNPSKRTKALTVTSIESLAGVLQPKLSASEVVDEWKLFQVDNDLPNYDRQE